MKYLLLLSLIANDDLKVQQELAWFTGALVLVSFLQFLALVGQAILFFRQARIMEQHRTSLEQLAKAAANNAEAASKNADFSKQNALATEKSAEAALLNAQALIHIERPWLILELVPTGPSIDEVEWYTVESTEGGTTTRAKHTDCTFHLMNYGRTPAIVTAQRWELQIGTDRLNPVDIEIFHKPTPVTPYIFPQGISQPRVAELAKPITQDMKAGVDILINFIWLCGFIQYKDSVPREIEVPVYETKFCYLYSESGGEPMWILGPSEYNRNTQ